MKKYRIKEIILGNDTSIYYPQYSNYGADYWDFMEDCHFPTAVFQQRVKFSSLSKAQKYIEKCKETEVKEEKIHYV